MAKKTGFKNCKKGFACGGGCISFTYTCHKDFPEGVSAPIDFMQKQVAAKIKGSPTPGHRKISDIDKKKSIKDRAKELAAKKVAAAKAEAAKPKTDPKPTKEAEVIKKAGAGKQIEGDDRKTLNASVSDAYRKRLSNDGYEKAISNLKNLKNKYPDDKRVQEQADKAIKAAETELNTRKKAKEKADTEAKAKAEAADKSKSVKREETPEQAAARRTKELGEKLRRDRLKDEVRLKGEFDDTISKIRKMEPEDAEGQIAKIKENIKHLNVSDETKAKFRKELDDLEKNTKTQSKKSSDADIEDSLAKIKAEKQKTPKTPSTDEVANELKANYKKAVDEGAKIDSKVDKAVKGGDFDSAKKAIDDYEKQVKDLQLPNSQKDAILSGIKKERNRIKGLEDENRRNEEHKKEQQEARAKEEAAKAEPSPKAKDAIGRISEQIDKQLGYGYDAEAKEYIGKVRNNLKNLDLSDNDKKQIMKSLDEQEANIPKRMEELKKKGSKEKDKNELPFLDSTKTEKKKQEAEAKTKETQDKIKETQDSVKATRAKNEEAKTERQIAKEQRAKAKEIEAKSKEISPTTTTGKVNKYVTGIKKDAKEALNSVEEITEVTRNRWGAQAKVRFADGTTGEIQYNRPEITYKKSGKIRTGDWKAVTDIVVKKDGQWIEAYRKTASSGKRTYDDSAYSMQQELEDKAESVWKQIING